MASSKQKCNGSSRSYFTNESPHFMKIILQETLQNCKLEIPKMFIRKYGNDMSSPVLLKVPSGGVWKVELRKRDGKVWLKNGWQEFSKHHSLEHGQFVVFRYQGNSKFHVAILDRTATEIQYPSTSSNYHEELKGIPEESEDDDNIIEIIEEIPPAPSRKLREKSQVPCPRPRKKMTSSNSANKTDHEVNLKSKSTKSCHRNRTQTLKAGEKSAALERAAKAFQSKNPFFIRVMQPSYVGLTKKWYLDLPAPFVRKRKHNLMRGNCFITLCNKDGTTWPVQLHQGPSGKTSLRAGWDVVVRQNKLQLGDVCAFELINSIETTLKVTIYSKQAVEDANHSLRQREITISSVFRESCKVPSSSLTC